MSVVAVTYRFSNRSFRFKVTYSACQSITQMDSQELAATISRAVVSAVTAALATAPALSAVAGSSVPNTSARPPVNPAAACTPNSIIAVSGDSEDEFEQSSRPSQRRHPLPTLYSQMRKVNRRKIAVNRQKSREKSVDVICLPYHKGDIFPIPRASSREQLALSKLIGKANICSSMTEQEVAQEIASIFLDTFKLAHVADFEFVYLSTMTGAKKLQKPKISSSYKWGGAEVINLTQKKTIYIMAAKGLKVKCLESSDSEGETQEKESLPTSSNVSNMSVCTARDRSELESGRMLHLGAPITMEEESGDEISQLYNGDAQVPHIVSELVTCNVDMMLEEEFERETQIALQRSMTDNGDKPTNLCDILTNLRNEINTSKISIFNVCREEIFQSCVRAMRRKTFSPLNSVSVSFSDVNDNPEGAVDAGGPTREMFCLVLRHLQNSRLFEGQDEEKNLALCNDALQEREYYEAGRIISMSLVHGGQGPQFLSETLYNCLVNGIEHTKPNIDEVLDPDIRQQIEIVQNSEDLITLQNAILSSSYFTLAGCGYVQDIQKKQQVVDEAVTFYVLHRIRPALDQFIEGLKTLHIFENMIKYCTYFKTAMCRITVQLTAAKMQEIFTVLFSTDGSNQRLMENRIVGYWRDYLLDCEENECEVTIADVLKFCTGADCIPPLGFSSKPTVKFLHAEQSPYPKANTCAIEIYLPTVHNNYKEFKTKMDYGITNGMVFGFA